MSLQYNLNLGKRWEGKSKTRERGQGVAWLQLLLIHHKKKKKRGNEKYFALHNYTYCTVSSCISWCCGWSEFPPPRKEFGIERDDEKHNFMVYGNLPPATGTLTSACKSLVQHKNGCCVAIRWVTHEDTSRGLTLKTQYIVPKKNAFINQI